MMFPETDKTPSQAAPGAVAENRAVLARIAAEGATWTVRAFAQAMLEIHPVDRLPSRGAFDPVEVPKLLSHLLLVEVERPDPAAEPRFLVKVQGQSVRDALKLNIAGKYLDEFTERLPTIAYPIEDRVTVCERGVAGYALRRPRTRIAFDFARIENLHVPFAEDGRTVDRILSLYAYEGEKSVRFER